MPWDILYALPKLMLYAYKYGTPGYMAMISHSNFLKYISAIVILLHSAIFILTHATELRRRGKLVSTSHPSLIAGITDNISNKLSHNITWPCSTPLGMLALGIHLFRSNCGHHSIHISRALEGGILCPPPVFRK